MEKDEQSASATWQGAGIFGLFGAGGFAREAMQILSEDRPQNPPGAGIFFVDREVSGDAVNGVPVLSEDQFFSRPEKRKSFNVAIGDSKVRAKIAADCIARSALPAALTSRHAVIYDHNRIGEGAIFCAHTTVTANATIGRFFHCNIYSYVAHDCVIGDFVTFAPHVHCNGNVHIHDHAYLGAGAIIKNGSASKPLVIGEGAVVGMGAVVTRDVPAFATVVGNPARPLQR